MEKHLSTEELAYYSEMLAKNKLSNVPSNIIEHIENCDSCAIQAIDLSLIIENTEITTTPIIDKRNILTRYKYIAIAASILLPILTWVTFNQLTKDKTKTDNITDNTAIVIDSIQNKNNTIAQQNNKDSLNIIKQNSTQEPKQQALLAYNEPNKELEKLTNYFVENLRGENITIITKSKLIITESNDIILKWKNIEEENLSVEIYDNKYLLIESDELSGNSYKVKSNLKKGLYYWKLINEDYDLLFCGKILVK